jgi:hypothetical protein
MYAVSDFYSWACDLTGEFKDVSALPIMLTARHSLFTIVNMEFCMVVPSYIWGKLA